jgi:hypothetical protein
MNRFRSSEAPLDIAKLRGHLLGAGFIIWLVTGSWMPMIVGIASVAILRRALHSLD